MTTTPVLLGIDCGTESLRVLAVDPAGNVLASTRAAHQTAHPLPGWAEQSPGGWWSGLCDAMRHLAATGLDPRSVAAIGVAATSSTVVFAERNGSPVRPAMLWMDVRAVAEAKTFEATGHPCLSVCPDGVSPEWGPVKASWLRNHESGAYARCDIVCEAGDWIVHELTGAWTANVPAAVTAWFYDAVENRWPVDLYQASGCGDLEGRLPERVLANGSTAGALSSSAATQLGLLPGIPVVQGGIDSVSAMLALGVTSDGPAALITGSSNVILSLSGSRVRSPGVWGGYASAAVPGLELVVGLHGAGSALSWLTREIFGGRPNIDSLEREAAEIAPGSSGLIALPDFQGNRTPFTEPRARGAIWGLSLGHRPAHLYHAMLEGIAFASRHAIDAIETAGVPIRSLRACGGATGSALTMQVYANVLNRPIATTATIDASALGAAMSAAIGIGIHADFATASARMGRDGQVYEPDPAASALYDHRYELFRASYPALLPLMRQMAELQEGP